LLIVAILLVAPEPAEAQEAIQRLDVEVGLGYAIGGGLEEPGPTLPRVNVGVVVWFAGRFGVALGYVRGFGEDTTDSQEPLEDLGDRRLLAQKDLRYFRASFRYKHEISRALVDSVEFGGGMIIDGSFTRVSAQLASDGTKIRTFEQEWGALAAEFFAAKRLGRHFGLKAGATFDFNFDTHFLTPVFMGVASF
jgi:hypothetical protein